MVGFREPAKVHYELLAKALGIKSLNDDTPVPLPALARALDRHHNAIKAMVDRLEFPAPDSRQSPVGRKRWEWRAETIVGFLASKARGGR